MAGNSFGRFFRLSTFGESHGPAVGGVIDGFPANVEIDIDFIQSELDRRRPGQSKYVSKRNEKDKIEILSGIFNGKSLGTPIGFIVRNNDKKSSDYNHLKDVYRPSHADYTYQMKYGIRDYRGGGRSSARETLARVVGGAFAKILLSEQGIRITAFVDGLGGITTKKDYQQQDFSLIENNQAKVTFNTIMTKTDKGWRINMFETKKELYLEIGKVYAQTLGKDFANTIQNALGDTDQIKGIFQQLIKGLQKAVEKQNGETL